MSAGREAVPRRRGWVAAILGLSVLIALALASYLLWPLVQRERLCRAAERGDVHTIEALLAHGVQPDWRGDPRTDVPPLHRAATNGHADAVRALVHGGARVNRKLFGGTPLVLAVRAGKLETAAALLELGANPNSWEDDQGRRSLHFAVTQNREDICRLLLDARAKPGPGDNGMWTPLHYAVRNRRHSLARLLLERGAEPNKLAHDAPPEQNRPDTVTPLDLAEANHDDAAIELLTEFGGKTSAQLWQQAATAAPQPSGK